LPPTGAVNRSPRKSASEGFFGKESSQLSLAEAATLAAWYSRARTSGSVPVAWTRRKYVRKPRKAPPGSVLPDRVETVFVKPSSAVEAGDVLFEIEPEAYDIPRYVPTQATFLKRGSNWVITASGGVQVFPWQVADRSEELPSLARVRQRAADDEGATWWWQ